MNTIDLINLVKESLYNGFTCEQAASLIVKGYNPSITELKDSFNGALEYFKANDELSVKCQKYTNDLRDEFIL